MSTLHAWFSQDAALRGGSSVYRKPGGCVVNVTRTSADRKEAGRYRNDEKYLGEVLADEDGGLVTANHRTPSITPD